MHKLEIRKLVGRESSSYQSRSQSQSQSRVLSPRVGRSLGNASLFQPRASSFNDAFPCAVEFPDVTPWKSPEPPEQKNPVPHTHQRVLF